jgi:predicted CxxxxCH...CXXCH cytochrome family protein
MTTAPGSGPGQLEHSAFANTTLETWSQTELTTGCMSCHGFTQNDHVDFVWSLLMNAYPPGQSRASSLAVKALQDLLTKREVR